MILTENKFTYYDIDIINPTQAMFYFIIKFMYSRSRCTTNRADNLWRDEDLWSSPVRAVQNTFQVFMSDGHS